MRGGEKLFRQDGGRFNKAHHAARAGRVLVLGAANHSWVRESAYGEAKERRRIRTMHCVSHLVEEH
jgi:hypothetical protein